MNTSDVIFQVKGNIGLITLNRPEVLNSLSTEMCIAIHDQLKKWEPMLSVQAVVIQGAGAKAFCAGGDVVTVAKAHKAGTSGGRDFFGAEYRMNVAIREFSKPYISLVDGIVMGGGVGVSLHGNFWVATGKTLFAMPETGLGLITDVGGGWFLPRLPGETGMYLALTGARLKAADLYALGMASHVVPSVQIPNLVAELTNARISNVLDVKAILKKYHEDPESAPMVANFADIDQHFSAVTVAGIMRTLKRDPSDWAQEQYELMLSKSPLSMKLTFAQLRRGAVLDKFRDVMRMEYRLVCHILEGHDFYEGVRAILVDKDKKPVWQHKSLDDIPVELVDSHFRAPQTGDLSFDE